MKKIKLSVAALLIAGMSYGQSACCIKTAQDVYEYEGLTMDSYQENVKQFKAVEFMVEDLIDAIRMDMFYGHLERQRGEYYINMILKVKSVNRDIMAGVFRNEEVK